MSDYTYRRIITDRGSVANGEKIVNVPDEIVKKIRADVIDEYKEEVLSRFCECCDQYACNGAMIGSRQECTTICMLRDVCTDIANELKEQNKWQEISWN